MNNFLYAISIFFFQSKWSFFTQNLRLMIPIKFIFLYVLLLLQVSPITGDFTQSPSPSIPGLITYWSFDHIQNNLVFDDSNNNATGNLVNTTITNGISGNALSFNGVDSYILLNASSLPSFQTFTVAFWFRASNSNTMAQLFGLQNDFYEDFGLLINKTNSGFFTWVMYENKWVGGLGTTFNDYNTWHFFAFTYSGNNITIFFDQSQYIQFTDLLPLSLFPEPLLFGISKNATGLMDSFSGSLDEIRIYNRVLSNDEVHSLYLLDSKNLPANSLPSRSVVFFIFTMSLILMTTVVYFVRFRHLKGDYSRSNYMNSNTSRPSKLMCSNCSSKLDLNDDFCPNCGNPVSKDEKLS